MYELLQIVSGWTTVVVFFGLVFYPILCITLLLLKTYLTSASDGGFELEIPWWFRPWESYSKPPEGTNGVRGFTFPLTILISLLFWAVSASKYYHNRLEGETYLEYIAEEVIPPVFTFGGYLTSIFITVGVLYGLHKLLRVLFKYKNKLDKLEEK